MKKAKKGKTVRMAAMAPSVGPRKSGKVRSASSGVDWTNKSFGGGKVTDRGIKR